MSTPAIIYLVLSGIGLLISAHDHGKPRTPTNFWTTLAAGILCLGLLYWGGFFK